MAIFACNDIPARALADTCSQLGLHIPSQVALLGVDNDDLECSMTVPPLSSIAIPDERIGYEAAHLLDQIMSGGRRPTSPLFLPPVRVVPRQSTDTLAVSDPVVSAAIRFIYEHATEGVNVESVVLHVAVHRRELERKFRRIVGHSVLHELRRSRIEHAKAIAGCHKAADVPHRPAIRLLHAAAHGGRVSVVRAGFTDGLSPPRARMSVAGHVSGTRRVPLRRLDDPANNGTRRVPDTFGNYRIPKYSRVFRTDVGVGHARHVFQAEDAPVAHAV